MLVKSSSLYQCTFEIITELLRKLTVQFVCVASRIVFIGPLMATNSRVSILFGFAHSGTKGWEGRRANWINPGSDSLLTEDSRLHRQIVLTTPNTQLVNPAKRLTFSLCKCHLAKLWKHCPVIR